MNLKTAFIGHRDILPDDIEKRLKKAINEQINLGCKSFIKGTHGSFDKISLSCCRSFKRKDNNIDIIVVITSFHQINSYKTQYRFIEEAYNPYLDVKTIMYEIEEIHFKRKIIESNKLMIDECSTLICYVKPNNSKSGAGTVMNYAKQKGLKIINLYKNSDDDYIKV